MLGQRLRALGSDPVLADVQRGQRGVLGQCADAIQAERVAVKMERGKHDVAGQRDHARIADPVVADIKHSQPGVGGQVGRPLVADLVPAHVERGQRRMVRQLPRALGTQPASADIQPIQRQRKQRIEPRHPEAATPAQVQLAQRGRQSYQVIAPEIADEGQLAQVRIAAWALDRREALRGLDDQLPDADFRRGPRRTADHAQPLLRNRIAMGDHCPHLRRKLPRPAQRLGIGARCFIAGHRGEVLLGWHGWRSHFRPWLRQTIRRPDC